jgi:hypothetical protein
MRLVVNYDYGNSHSPELGTAVFCLVRALSVVVLEILFGPGLVGFNPPLVSGCSSTDTSPRGVSCILHLGGVPVRLVLV